MKALGMIEVYGYLAAVEALDSALKAANVSLVDVCKVKGGLVTVLVEGEVGAVKASMDASAAAVERVGRVVSVHVIPRPAVDVARMFTKDFEYPHVILSDGELHAPGEETAGTAKTLTEAENTTKAETLETSPVIETEGYPRYDEGREVVPEAQTDGSLEDKKLEDKNGEDQVMEGLETSQFTREQLEQMTVAGLRKLARDIGITNMTRQEIRFAKKQELIHAILNDTRQEK